MWITQGLFSDVLANAPQRFGNNTIDWSQVKPFQVIRPMSSWTATTTGATAPTQTTTPAPVPKSTYETWLEAQTQRASELIPIEQRGYGGGQNTAARGVSDKSFAEAKDARDYAQGFNNQDKVAAEIAASFLTSPLGTLKKIEALQEKMKEAQELDSLFSQMLAADKEAKSVAEKQAAEQANSLMPGMVVSGALTPANPMALDPMQAMQQQAETPANDSFLSSISVPTVSAQQPTSQADVNSSNNMLGEISLFSNLAPAPAPAPAPTLAPAPAPAPAPTPSESDWARMASQVGVNVFGRDKDMTLDSFKIKVAKGEIAVPNINEYELASYFANSDAFNKINFYINQYEANQGFSSTNPRGGNDFGPSYGGPDGPSTAFA